MLGAIKVFLVVCQTQLKANKILSLPVELSSAHTASFNCSFCPWEEEKLFYLILTGASPHSSGGLSLSTSAGLWTPDDVRTVDQRHMGGGEKLWATGLGPNWPLISLSKTTTKKSFTTNISQIHKTRTNLKKNKI